MILTCDPLFSPAVVPIVVNAGAAILPALIAAAASFFTLLLRPRQLVRACARRPLTAATTVAVLALTAFALTWLATHAPRPAVAAEKDFWDALARQRIAEHESPLLTTTPAATSNSPDVPVGLGRTFARCNYDNGPVPTNLRPLPLWSEETDGYVLSSPVLRDDPSGQTRVYGTACVLSLTGQTGAVFCRDAATGKLLWRTDAAPDGTALRPFFSSPALTADGKHLVIGEGLHEDRNCEFLCFDAATGAIEWHVPTELHIESSPAIFTHAKYGDVAVVGCGAIEGPDHKPTSDPGHVLAVQIATGKLLWKAPVNDPESSPAVGPDGTVYIGSGFNGNAVVALRSETDADLRGQPRILWKTPTPFPATGAVTLLGHTLLIGCGNGDFVVSDPHPQGAILALDRATGKILWQLPTPDAVLGEIAATPTLALAPCKTGDLLACNPATGELLWSQPISGKNALLTGVILTSPPSPHAYAVSKDGYLAILDLSPLSPPTTTPATTPTSTTRPPRILQKVFLNDEAHPGDLGLCLSTPTLHHGRLYVGSETGGLRCFIPTSVAK